MILALAFVLFGFVGSFMPNALAAGAGNDAVAVGATRDDPGDPPDIGLDPNAIEIDLYTGAKLDTVVTVTNNNDAAINFTVEAVITQEGGRDGEDRGIRSLDGNLGPRRDDAGEVLSRFRWNRAGQNQYKAGIAYDWDNDLLVLTTYSPNWMAVVDPNNDYQVVREWQPGGNPMGCAWLDGSFYTVMWANQFLMRYDIDGRNLGNFNVNIQGTSVTTSQELEAIFVSDGGNNNINVYDVDAQRLGTINANGGYWQFEGNQWQRSLCWVDQHPDGQLWVNTPGRIWQIEINPANWTATRGVQNWGTNAANAQQWDGLGHDKHNLIYGPYGEAEYRVYDDGITEAYWLNFSPSEGQIAAGASQDIDLNFDAYGLIGGRFAATLHIMSNDQDNPDAQVDIVLNVEAAPDIEVEWDEAYGYPNTLDWNMMYRDLFAGGPYTMTYTIINAGTDDLSVEGIDPGHAYFSVDQENFVIAGGEERVVTVTFNAPADDPNVYEPIMTISSSDPDERDVDIQLHAEAQLPPICELDQNAWTSEELYTGDSTDVTLNITNNGDALLRWESEIEIMQEGGGRDGNSRGIRSLSNGGPRRDEVDLDGMLFANFQTNSVWAWLDDGMRQDPLLDENNFHSYRNADDWNNVNFDDYNVICVSAYSQQFNQQYADNLERFEEYIADGGCAYFETGNTNQAIRSPGGIYNDIDGGAGNGQLIVSPDPNADNYSLFAEICHESQPNNWEEGEVIEGNSWLHSTYSHQQFDDGIENGTIEWYQPIASVQGNPDSWGAITYGFGRGAVMTVGHPSAHCWFNWTQDGMWGSIAAEILYYLTEVGGAKWITIDPKDGVIEGGFDQNVNVHFNSFGLTGGDYVADIHILTNDPHPDRRDMIFTVTMVVIADPDIEVEWANADGYPDVLDWNLHYQDLFTNGPYDMFVKVANVGGDDMTVSEAFADHEYFTVEPENTVIGIGEELAFRITFNAPIDDPDDYNTTLHFITNDHDEGEVTVPLHANASLPPIIVLEADSVRYQKRTGETEEFALGMANEGDAVLRWKGKLITTLFANEPQDRDGNSRAIRSLDGRSGPRRDDAGEILEEYRIDFPSTVGLAWDPDNSVLWGYANNPGGTFFKFDQDAGEIIETYNVTEKMDGMVYFEGRIYVNGSAWNPVLKAYDLEGNEVEQIRTPFNMWNGHSHFTIAGEGDEAYMLMRTTENWGGDDASVVRVYSWPDFQEVAQIQDANVTGDRSTAGILWTPNVREGQLWVDGCEQIYQLIIDDDWNCELVQTFDVQGTVERAGLAYDGKNIWRAVRQWNGGQQLDDHTMLQYIDNGVNESAWCTFEPEEGELQAQANDNIILHFDATGLYGGAYSGDLHFYTNDPASPDVVFVANMEVTGAADVNPVWDDEAGYPESVNWNGVYADELYAGGPYPIELTIENIGTDDLELNDVYTNNEVFTTNWDPDRQRVIGAAEETVITLTFNTQNPGDIRGVLTLITSDEDEAQVDIPLAGVATNPPIMTLSFVAINDTTVTGDVVRHDLEIGNDGDANLRYQVQKVILQEPGDRDRAEGRGIRSLSRAAGPRRDEVDLDGKMFAWFQAQNIWGWLYEGMLQDPLLDDNNCVWYQGADDWNNVDFSEYDAICIAAYSQPWNAQYRDNLERLEEYVADGGALYYETANSNAEIRSPGGIYNDNQASSSNGILVVSPDPGADNYSLFAEICHESQPNFWNEGEVIEGSAWLHGGYNEQQFIDGVDNGTLEWYQIIAMQQDNRNVPGAVAYGFGAGTVLTVGHPVGHTWFNFNQEGMWGSIAAEILYYLTEASGAKWLSIEPTEGEIRPDDALQSVVTLDAANLIGGDYIADLNFISNDPVAPLEEADATIRVTMNVTGVPNVDVTPGGPEEGGEEGPADFGIVYYGYPESIIVSVQNVGTEDLEVNDVLSDDNNPDFYVNGDDIQAWVLAVGEKRDLNVWYDPNPERGEGEIFATLTFITNDPRYPDGYAVLVRGDALPRPILVLETNQISRNLDEGDPVEEVAVDVSNDGDSQLNWEASIEITGQPGRDENGRGIRSLNARGPLRDDAGELLGQFQGINAVNMYSSPVGWDWDNERMWVTQYNNGFAVAYTHDNGYENFEEVARINGIGNNMDGCMADGLFFVPNSLGGNVLNRYDPDGQNIGALNFGFGIYGLAWDMEEDWLFVLSSNDMLIHVYQLDGEGGLANNNEIGVIRNHLQYHANQTVYGLEWVSKHPNGQLWMTSPQDRRVHQILVDTEQWTCVEEVQAFVVFPAADQPYSSVGHDGHNLWVGGYAAANYRIYDDGTFEAYWITMDPMEGSLAARGSQNVTVSLSTEGNVGGRYSAIIYFESNDPENPVQEIQVSMNIQGMSVFGSEPVSAPFTEEPNVMFPVAYAGFESAVPILFTNVGSGVYAVTGYEVDGANPDDFGIVMDQPFEINSRADSTVTFWFRPSETGERTARLHLTTNAMNVEGQDVYWDLTGIGMLPPQIYTRPENGLPRVYARAGGDASTATLTIGNAEGQDRDTLSFKVSTMELDNGRDASARGIRSLSGKAGPLRDEPGDVLQTVELNYTGPMGISRDAENGIMWVDHYSAGRVVGYLWDGEQITGTVADFPVAGASNVGGTVSNGVYYGAQFQGTLIYLYDLEGRQLRTMNMPDIPISFCVDAERGYLFYCTYPGFYLRVLDINNNFAEVGIVRNMLGHGDDANARARMAWVPEHRDGHLWMTYEFNAYQINITDDWQWEEVQHWGFQSDRNAPGIANDGVNTWIGNIAESVVRIHDDGASEGLSWVTIDPEKGEILAGQETDVTFTCSPVDLEEGIYEGRIFIKSNDPGTPDLYLGISMDVGNGPPFAHFGPYDPENPDMFPNGWHMTGTEHSVLVNSVLWDDQDAPSGWEIGCFTPGGVLSGGAVWTGGAPVGFMVYGEEGEFAQFRGGEQMMFKVWDNTANVEYNAAAEVSDGSIEWSNQGFTTLSLIGRSVYECVVPFGAGWNLISINVTPPQDLWNNNGPDVRQMMSQFRIDEGHHHLILMKNEAGNFYAPANRDFNNIPFWNTAEGYQVRMDQAQEGHWTGVQIEAGTGIDIAAGWNMIAYYPTYQLTCARNTFIAISSIVDNVILTKDGFGHFASPPNNFSNMDAWREGRGFQIKVNQAVTLNYPAQQQNAAAIKVGESDASVVGHWAAPVRTGANMSVLVTGISGADLAAADQVAAFNANGRLVGLGSVTDGMVGLAVWGDDASTEVVDGLLDKEAFTLKLWDADKKVEIGLNMGDLAYETDGFVASDAVAGRIIPDVYSLGQNFPNPFNAVTKLSFGMPEASRVSIRVFDIAGREVATLVSGNLEAGNHTAVWNAEGFNSGVYLVKMETPSFSDVRKVTLIK